GVVGDLGVGKWVHGKCIKYGLVSDSVVGSSLMSMYGKCGGREDLCRVFEEMPKRSVSSWNVMLSRCVDGENGEKAFSFVKCMLMEGLKPNQFTLSNLLPLCESGLVWGRFDYGRELQRYIIRNEMNVDVDSSVHLDCCLIDMYSRRCKVSLTRVIFDRMRFKNVFAWTAMMSGYLQNGDPDETVLIFRAMLRRRVELNEVTLLTLLPAFSLVGELLGVRQVHGFSVKKGFANHTRLCNSLIDMYSKNGLLSYAVKVFDHGCFSKDAVSWSSIISGYGLHGKGQEAVALYDKMLTSAIKPDAISVVGVLSACSRSGLVEKGLDVYDKAISVYGIKPTMEMCSCVVDLLGRSGQLDEALSFIKTLRLEPGPSVWGAFVSACMVHADHETRVLVYKALIKVEPENPSNYAF
ncbi:pentatricopeptide repeat-containing protein, partial [Tanacetum coccineum]